MLPFMKLNSQIYNENGETAEVSLELHCTECGFLLADFDSALRNNGFGKIDRKTAEMIIIHAESNPVDFFKPAYNFLHTCSRKVYSVRRGPLEIFLDAAVSVNADPDDVVIPDSVFTICVRHGALNAERCITPTTTFQACAGIGIDRALFDELRDRASHQNLPLHKRAPWPEMVLGCTDEDDWNTVPVQEIRVHGVVVGYLYADPSNPINCVSYTAGS